MTKIKEKTKQTNVQLHIDKAFETIDEHLPNPYVDRVLLLLKEPLPSSGTIRNIRMRVTPGTKRVDIINALLEVAKQNQADKLKLAELIK